MTLIDEICYKNDIENKIVKELSYFPEIINDLLKSNEPAHLTKYIFGLTQQFSRFYEQVNISNEEDIIIKSSRIRLLKAIAKVIKEALSILGINSIDSL